MSAAMAVKSDKVQGTDGGVRGGMQDEPFFTCGMWDKSKLTSS